MKLTILISICSLFINDQARLFRLPVPSLKRYVRLHGEQLCVVSVWCSKKLDVSATVNNLFFENLLEVEQVSLLLFFLLLFVSLDCKPSQLKPSSVKSSNWSSCPAMACEGSNLLLGNSTASDCNTTTCAYAGFSKQTIFTNISTLNTCPGPEGELRWL